MLTTITIENQCFNVNTHCPYSLAIDVYFNHDKQQPSHFGASPALAKPMQAGGFIGDTEQGGSCNVNELVINPHCNGTHTETIAHICHANNSLATKVSSLELPPLMPCVLISVTPITAMTCSDEYTPTFNADDFVINRQQLEQQLSTYHDEQIQCVAVRTLPNTVAKCQENYNANNQPAFFSRDAVLYLNKRGVEHLILDIPSLDRLDDGGLLTCHHLFWQVFEGAHQPSSDSLINKTITEMAYIDNAIVDGFYFANIQTPAFVNDAAPSRPVLYKAERINSVNSLE